MLISLIMWHYISSFGIKKLSSSWLIIARFKSTKAKCIENSGEIINRRRKIPSDDRICQYLFIPRKKYGASSGPRLITKYRGGGGGGGETMKIEMLCGRGRDTPRANKCKARRTTAEIIEREKLRLFFLGEGWVLRLHAAACAKRGFITQTFRCTTHD